MADESPATIDDVARQVRAHLDGLLAAGVEWLPRLPPLRPAVPPRPAATRPSATGGDPTPPAPLALPVVAEDIDPRHMDLEQRRAALARLAQQVSQCTRCAGLASTRRQTVFGVGQPSPELCLIGEAPGADEDRQGEPFVGAAGQLLNRIIAACGLKREELYICNILRCRPPGNRTPEPEEAANCREWLDATLALVQPKFICCLGATAAKNLLGLSIGITRMRGRFYDYQGIPVMPTFHPSALLHDPSKKRDVWEDMKKVLARMGRPIPGGS